MSGLLLRRKVKDVLDVILDPGKSKEARIATTVTR